MSESKSIVESVLAEHPPLRQWCVVCGGLESYAVHRAAYVMQRVPWDIPGHAFVAPPVSPWVRNAIAGTLPASDRTGTVRA